MSVVRRHIANGAISPYKLADALRKAEYFYADQYEIPQAADQHGVGVPTGVADTFARLKWRLGENGLMYYGGNATNLNPQKDKRSPSD